MSGPQLSVSGPETRAPLPAHMPLASARRWFAPDEGAEDPQHFPVFVSREAYDCILEHTSSSLEHEVGGILAGTWCIDQGSARQFIIIEAALPARFTRHGSTFLTFTHESLVDMHSELEERFPGKQIVGWYHTHPGMGIFLSPYDTWLHDNFFPETWQVALVVEPVSMTGGFFSRQPDGNLPPTRYAGFYELAGSPGQSIVRMNNLWLGPETSAQKGVFI